MLLIQKGNCPWYYYNMLRTVFLYLVKSMLIFSVVFSIGGFFHFFILEPSEVNGRSMEGTLIDQQIILINKVALLISKPRRGQIVSVFDEYDNLLLVKRIVGLPGEQVIIRDGQVYIISREGSVLRLDENYLNKNTLTLPEEGIEAHYGVIGEAEYFLLGDNRARSVDSRRYGTIHRSQIVGLVHRLPF